MNPNGPSDAFENSTASDTSPMQMPIKTELKSEPTFENLVGYLA